MARFPNAQPGKQRNVYDTWVLDHQAQPNPEMDPLQPERIALWKSGELLVMRNQKEMVVKLAAFRGEMQPVER